MFCRLLKGFDIIDQNILLQELCFLNVDQTLYVWIKAFLTNRTQALGVVSSLSPWRHTHCLISYRAGAWHYRIFVDFLKSPVSKWRIVGVKTRTKAFFFEEILINIPSENLSKRSKEKLQYFCLPILCSNLLSNNSGILPILPSNESLWLDLSLIEVLYSSKTTVLNFRILTFWSNLALSIVLTARNDLCFTLYFGSHFQSRI